VRSQTAPESEFRSPKQATRLKAAGSPIGASPLDRLPRAGRRRQPGHARHPRVRTCRRAAGGGVGSCDGRPICVGGGV